MSIKKKYKVVYNGCYGGFGLSNEAVRWLEQNATDQELRDFIVERRKNIDTEELYGIPIESVLGCEIVYEFKETGIPRHHKDLVAVVETLGEKASGEFSELNIKKIKGGVYKIDNYDGWETVAEPEDYEWVWIHDEQ